MIFVGRLSPEKNVGCLIRAISLLAQRGRAVSLTIVGAGAERVRLEADCRAHAEGLCRFVEYVENAELRRTRFLGADVLVLPSREERQGKVLLEAMACSVPVAAARAGGIPTVVRHRVTGLLFDPESPQELAACLAAVADDPALRANLIQNAYCFASENTLDTSVAQIMSEVAARYELPVSALSDGMVSSR